MSDRIARTKAYLTDTHRALERMLARIARTKAYLTDTHRALERMLARIPISEDFSVERIDRQLTERTSAARISASRWTS